MHLRRFIGIIGLFLALAGGATAQELISTAPTPEPQQERQQQPATPAIRVPSLPPGQLPAVQLPTAPDDLWSLAPQRPVFQHQGALVEKLDGQVIYEQASDQGFNPASAVKLATALTALRTFGAQHRFNTAIWTNGTFDAATGTVNGDLVVSGRDPSFHFEHAVLIARELNRRGIRSVTGDLVVAPRFTMNFSASAQRSGEQFYDTLDATRRPAAATRAWYDNRIALGDTTDLQNPPSVAVLGAVYVASVPAGARMLVTHRSSTLVDILKVLLCYSNNFMAERLGDMLGGADGVRRFLVSDVGLPAAEVRLASTSGLGVNRLTPRGMMKVYRVLREELKKSKLTPADIMPVAGIDPGTLDRRYRSSMGRGSIIAKTGTLIRTDGGASALVGQFRTQSNETMLFVIFNQRGSVGRFRENQDRLIADLQSARGGPAPFTYSPHALAMRLVDTAFDAGRNATSDEYEAGANELKE